MVFTELQTALTNLKIAYALVEGEDILAIKRAELSDESSYCLVRPPAGTYNIDDSSTVTYRGNFLLVDEKDVGTLANTLDKQQYQTALFERAKSIFNAIKCASKGLEGSFDFKFVYEDKQGMYGIAIDYNLKVWK